MAPVIMTLTYTTTTAIGLHGYAGTRMSHHLRFAQVRDDGVGDGVSHSEVLLTSVKFQSDGPTLCFDRQAGCHSYESKLSEH